MSLQRRKRRAPTRGTPERAKRRGAGTSKPRPLRPKKSRTAKRATKKTTKKTKPTKAKTPVSTKAAIRTTLRAKRAQLSGDQQKLAAKRVLANLVTARVFRVSRRVACYLPNDGEIDTSDIIERMWRMRKSVFLPVLSRMTHDRLWFAPAILGTELVPNRYGIPEPRVQARELVRAEKLDLILLPVVAFDNKGNRVGRGAGFYDRSLAFLRYRRFLRKPHLLGLAHDFQRTSTLTVDPWDVPLDGVVTDQIVHYANR